MKSLYEVKIRSRIRRIQGFVANIYQTAKESQIPSLIIQTSTSFKRRTIKKHEISSTIKDMRKYFVGRFSTNVNEDNDE